MLPSVEVLLTTRIAQLTGSTSASNPTWPESVDPMGWPLLNDTGRWGVTGVDLGANTEHSDGRLYFFFGDVAVESDEARPGYSGDWRTMKESDLVAWTDDREIFRCGGHLEQGWNFLLPNDEQGAGETTGQPDWRFCVRCGGLFHAPNGNTSGSVCPKRGEHAWFGKKFFLPNDHQAAGDATGQRDWRFCRNCHGLFWAPGDRPAGACPRGGQHDPLGWFFFLPNDSMGANDAVGQRDWRFCRNCHGLFWAGSGFKGLCPGAENRGGGFHLHAVERDAGRFRGTFAPLNADDPIGFTSTFEVPSGAFSHNGRVYVFVNIAETKYSERVRFGDPAYGLYLVSTGNPASPGTIVDDVHFTPTYRREFLFSPRMGRCPKPSDQGQLESHEILGRKFVLPEAPPGTPIGRNQWRLCAKCEAIFFNDGFGGSCWAGGSHEAGGGIYALPMGTAEDARHQSNWRRCRNCNSLFWDGDHEKKGLCRRGGTHDAADDAPLLIPHLSEAEDPHNNNRWRFCVKCHGMVRSDQLEIFAGAAACVVDNADHDLPSREGKGVVLFTKSFGRGHRNEPGHGYRLAWMPLGDGTPRLQDVRYYAGEPLGWSVNPHDAQALFEHTRFYTSVSVAWLDGPRCWILLYSDATQDDPTPENPDFEKFKLPVRARISTNLRAWSKPFDLFDPVRAGAYGEYGHQPFMHLPGRDTIDLDVPPLPIPTKDPDDEWDRREDKPGWAYGAFILNRYTGEWNPDTHELDIYYLMSTACPYQVQLMHSRLRISVLDIRAFAREWLNKSAHLSAGGQRADAIAAAQKAVDALRDAEISPELAAEQWTLFAVSLHTLTLRQLEDHRVDDALRPAADAVGAYRQAAAAAGADVPSVGGQLLNLSAQLSANTRPAEAVPPVEAAVDVLRGVVSAPQPVLVGPPWSIVGTGDFNLNGTADILWYNSATGEIQIWLMDRARVASRATVLGEDGSTVFIGPPWSIVGTGDFNLNGTADILWHNSATGEIQIWLMDGTRVGSRATVLGEDGSAVFIGPPWSIVATGDFNVDGTDDVLWYNSATGEIQIWFMNGIRVASRATVLGEDGNAVFIGPPWSIVGAGDFSSNGTADILWHNSSTGEIQIWFMDGARVASRATVLGEDGNAVFIGPPWSVVGA